MKKEDESVGVKPGWAPRYVCTRLSRMTHIHTHIYGQSPGWSTWTLLISPLVKNYIQNSYIRISLFHRKTSPPSPLSQFRVNIFIARDSLLNIWRKLHTAVRRIDRKLRFLLNSLTSSISLNLEASFILPPSVSSVLFSWILGNFEISRAIVPPDV